MRWNMAASYKKLFKLLIDREMKSKELAAKAGISPATLAKMKKDGATVSSDVLVKICTALECTLDDIVEIVPSNSHENSIRIEFFGDEVERISEFDTLTGAIVTNKKTVTIFAASHFVTDEEKLKIKNRDYINLM